MDDTTILGGVLNQLGQTAKQAVKQVVKLPEEMAGDLGRQIGGDKPAISTENPDNSKQWQSDEDRIKFLKDLYGKTDMSKDGSSGKKPTEFQEQIADKSPEEQRKLMELRNQLHQENYYDPTFNPVKKQEERPAEKIENEKKQEMMDLQQKEADKPQPIAVIREQNKAEMFRGAAG
jgi:hypothetical protein